MRVALQPKMKLDRVKDAIVHQEMKVGQKVSVLVFPEITQRYG